MTCQKKSYQNNSNVKSYKTFKQVNFEENFQFNIFFYFHEKSKRELKEEVEKCIM